MQSNRFFDVIRYGLAGVGLFVAALMVLFYTWASVPMCKQQKPAPEVFQKKSK
jgi:hypothetical protein